MRKQSIQWHFKKDNLLFFLFIIKKLHSYLKSICETECTIMVNYLLINISGPAITTILTVLIINKLKHLQWKKCEMGGTEK